MLEIVCERFKLWSSKFKTTHRYVVVIAFLEKFQASQFPGSELVDDHTLRTDVTVYALRVVMQEDQRLGDLWMQRDAIMFLGLPFVQQNLLVSLRESSAGFRVSARVSAQLGLANSMKIFQWSASDCVEATGNGLKIVAFLCKPGSFLKRAVFLTLFKSISFFFF